MKKLLLLSILSNFAFAATRSVDPTTFDVAGVKLGMSVEEAIAALAQHQEVEPSTIEPQKYPPKNIITGKEEPNQFELKKDHVRIILKFTPSVEQSGKMLVSEIQYNISATEDNVKALEEAVKTKYGEPSYNGLGGWRYCLEIDEKEIMKCKNIYTDPQLIYNHSLLKLSDPRLNSALETWKKQQQTTKPKI